MTTEYECLAALTQHTTSIAATATVVVDVALGVDVAVAVQVAVKVLLLQSTPPLLL